MSTASRFDLALQLAKKAGQSTLPLFKSANLQVERKGDSSPVTEADKNAENIIRRGIDAAFPEDGILGEEFGEKAGSNEYQWIVDPIDGTVSYIHGVPFYGTLIGILENGVPIIGILYLPALDILVFARDGITEISEKGGEPIRAAINSCDQLKDAFVCTSSRDYFRNAGLTDAWNRIADNCQATRTWGDCYGYYLLVSGRIDLMLDASVHPWDCAALMPIVQGAGGFFADFNGEAKIDSGHCISGGMSVAKETLGLISL